MNRNGGSWWERSLFAGAIRESFMEESVWRGLKNECNVLELFILKFSPYRWVHLWLVGRTEWTHRCRLDSENQPVALESRINEVENDWMWVWKTDLGLYFWRNLHAIPRNREASVSKRFWIKRQRRWVVYLLVFFWEGDEWFLKVVVKFSFYIKV